MFVKDGKTYRFSKKSLQSGAAFACRVNHVGKPVKYVLTDAFGLELPDSCLYKPYFCDTCYKCGNKMICNGCGKCGKCAAVNTES